MSPLIYCVYAAHCLDKECDWRVDGDDANRQAERHEKATGHATITSTRPEGTQ